MLVLLFALVDLEMELVPKGYYIDANVATGRRLLRVVFTLNQGNVVIFSWEPSLTMNSLTHRRG